jgi:MerR family redox-sensitive transcriptional activator SoxR
MTIGELASNSGVHASTIRYWERIGLLSRPPRVGGKRRYSSDAVHSIAILCLAQVCGFRLAEIDHLLHGFRPDFTASKRWKAMAQGKRRELSAQIARLNGMLQVLEGVRRCECAQLTDCGRIFLQRRSLPAARRP